jgi:protein-tyrosine phosphatase
MFVYRAVMEMAQFGDTEIEASKLKSTWLTFVSDDAGNKKLDEEFARLASIVDDRKALSVGECHCHLRSILNFAPRGKL